MDMKKPSKFALENPFPVLRIGHDGKILFANPASESLLRDWNTSLGSGAPDDLMKMVDRAIEMREPQIAEKTIQDKHFAFHIVPVKDMNYVNIYGNDVTYLKRAQDDLRESEARYHSLFNNMSEGFALHEIVCDDSGTPVNYRFLDINPAFERFTGLKSGQVLGKLVRDVIPGIEDAWIENYGRVALTGDPIRFESFSAPLNRWFGVYAYRPADMQFAVVFTDVTERRRADEEIKNIARFPLENPYPVMRVHRQGKIIFANAASRAYLEEWKTAEGDNLPEDWINIIVHASETGERQITEREIGARRYAFNVVPVAGADYVNVYGNDITHLKQIQDELREHKNHLEDMVKERTEELLDAYKELSKKQESLAEAQRIGRIGNWDLNIVTGELMWSDEIYRIFGLLPQQFGATYDAFLESVHPEDREFVIKSVDDALRGKKPYSIDHRIVLPGDTQKIVHEQAEVFRDGGGKAVRMVGTVQDITERRRAEEAAAAERRRLRDVLEMLPAYVALLTPDYQMPFANRFFRERFGESHGRRCYEFLFERSEPCKNCETYRVMKTGKPHEWEWNGPDGRIYRIFDFLFTDSDGATFIMEMGIDVTEQKHAENALREREKQLEMLSRKVISSQEEERTKICRNLHDELGQRLTALGMEIQWLAKQQEIRPADVENLGEALEAINLDLQRIYKGLRPTTLDRLGLKAAVESLVWDHKDHYKLKIQTEIDDAACKTDEDRAIIIYRIVQEALTNIARHAGASEVRVGLRRDEKHIIMEISDDGGGFKPEAAAGGSGMGLMGMKERAAMFGGTLEIDTEPGRGTSIRMTITAD